MDGQFGPFGQIQRVGHGGLVVLALRLEHFRGEHLGGLRPRPLPTTGRTIHTLLLQWSCPWAFFPFVLVPA